MAAIVGSTRTAPRDGFPLGSRSNPPTPSGIQRGRGGVRMHAPTPRRGRRRSPAPGTYSSVGFALAIPHAGGH